MGLFDKIKKAAKAPFKKETWKDAGKAIAKGTKAVVEGVAKVGDTVADWGGKAIEWTVDTAGDVVQFAGKAATAVTGIKAFEKAGNAVNNFTDDQLGPAMSRALTAPMRAVTGMPQSIMEKGLIDGVVHQAAERWQDVGGAGARLLGGKEWEGKFDTWYDEKAQKWIEMAAGTVARVALAIVPGGQLVLAADVASEGASLAYRAGNGEDLKWYDTIDFAAGAVTMGMGGGAAAARAGVSAGKAAGAASLKVSAKEGGKAGAKGYAKAGAAAFKEGGKASGAALKASGQQTLTSGTVAKGVAGTTTKEIAKQSATGFAGEFAVDRAFHYGSKHFMKPGAVAEQGDLGSVMPTGRYSASAGYDGSLNGYGVDSAPLPSSPHFASFPSGYRY